jgi:hypothetical protein
MLMGMAAETQPHVGVFQKERSHTPGVIDMKNHGLKDPDQLASTRPGSQALPLLHPLCAEPIFISTNQRSR